jgi:predicted MFS family arabinose efflux permease
VKKPDKVPLIKSFLAAMARSVGVALGAGAGSLIYKLMGPTAIAAWPLAISMFIGSFLLIWLLEYEREQIK